MIDALCFLTNKPLSTENNAEKNDEIKLSLKKINQVQESLQSSITWIKPKRIRWKNFTQPEKLQSTIVISITSKFYPIL